MPASISGNDETSARTCETGTGDLLVRDRAAWKLHDHGRKVISVPASRYVVAVDPDTRRQIPQTGDLEIALGMDAGFPFARHAAPE
jgi:hypothetical protein